MGDACEVDASQASETADKARDRRIMPDEQE